MKGDNTKIYKTPPQSERKARRELTRAGIRKLLPMEERSRRGPKGKDIVYRVPSAPGYIFADARPADATYVRECIGTVRREDLAPLYGRRRLPKPQPERPWRRNDRVLVSLATGDKTGTIVTVRKGSVGVDLDGARRTMQVSVKKLTLLNKVD
jgi:hypothetical protein